jgi:serine/threonine-protein kinase
MAAVHFGRLSGPVGFSRVVAIKRLHKHLARDRDFVAMFMDEARLAARVRHPNVVQTVDVVAEDEVFIVMEYIQGESVSRLVRAEKARKQLIPLPYALAIMTGTLHGLHAAHDAIDERGQPLGLVHRDVSPQNILVGIDGVPRVFDFGVAKAAGRLQDTRDGSLKGKVAYMSPEQLAKGAIDRRADVYSAAVVLWETLTGERLFKADDVPSLVYAIINEQVRRPSEIVPDLPPGLDEVVMKGLERESENRWSSAREMAAALEKVLQPAPAREIGEWVHSIAGDALDWRQELVHRIESETSSSIPPPLMRRESPVPREVTSGVVATDGADDGRDQAPTISNENHGRDDERETLLAPNNRTPTGSVLDDAEHDDDDHARPRIGLVAMAIGGLVFVVAGVLFGMRWVSSDLTAGVAPLTPTSATAPAESESAIVISESQRNPPAAVAPPPATTTTPPPPPPPVFTGLSGATRPRGNPTGVTPAPARDECDNPFTVDARGIRHPKPQCFNKK